MQKLARLLQNKVIKSICLGLLSTVTIYGISAANPIETRQSPLSLDFEHLYASVGLSTVIINVDGQLGSGVLLKNGENTDCEVVSVHRLTHGKSQITVTGSTLGSHLALIEGVDGQQIVDVYSVKDLAANSKECPYVNLGSAPLADNDVVSAMSYSGSNDFPRPLFGIISQSLPQ